MDRALRLLVTVTSLAAFGMAWQVVEQFSLRSASTSVVPVPAEERLDGQLSTDIAREVEAPDAQPSRLLVFLDPRAIDIGQWMRDIDALDTDSRKSGGISFRFAPAGATTPGSSISEAIAIECGRRQGSLLPVIDALASKSANASWFDVGVAARVHDLALFGDCVRRRETAAEVARSIVLARRLRLSVRPGFVLDQTVIRGSITIDSLRSRMRVGMQVGVSR